jgi:hypothetical protein
MLALVLALTPLTQVLAQAKQGPSAPEQTSELVVDPRPAVSPLSGRTDAILRVPALTPEAALLLRPAATGVFAPSESPPADDVAALSTQGNGNGSAQAFIFVVVVGLMVVAVLYSRAMRNCCW